ncbi:hypothetical protein V6N12_030025 [Hibiscus sabdariffa]|uniref:Uncharacterized protein n=1 Tax=Hibiscus sabdariffa TaxID=183260 RepID=A0ABR2CJ44_9ROSI
MRCSAAPIPSLLVPEEERTRLLISPTTCPKQSQMTTANPAILETASKDASQQTLTKPSIGGSQEPVDRG